LIASAAFNALLADEQGSSHEQEEHPGGLRHRSWLNGKEACWHSARKKQNACTQDSGAASVSTYVAKFELKLAEYFWRCVVYPMFTGTCASCNYRSS
jgi:uncharacterized membrane protein